MSKNNRVLLLFLILSLVGNVFAYLSSQTPEEVNTYEFRFEILDVDLESGKVSLLLLAIDDFPYDGSAEYKHITRLPEEDLMAMKEHIGGYLVINCTNMFVPSLNCDYNSHRLSYGP